MVVKGPTSLNLGKEFCFFNIRRNFGDVGRLVLVKNAEQNVAESTKYWRNSSKSLSTVRQKGPRIYYDGVRTGRKNRHLREELSQHMKKCCI